MADELGTTLENLNEELTKLTNQISKLDEKEYSTQVLKRNKANLEKRIKLKEEEMEVETSTLEVKKEILEDLIKGSQSLGVLANKLNLVPLRPPP